MKYVANDCCEFSIFEKGNAKNNLWDPLIGFTESFRIDSVWNFYANAKRKVVDFDENPFAAFDYSSKKWRAGRWIGSQTNEKHTFIVNPRFGILSLVSLFEEIFSLNILDNLSDKDINNHIGLFQVLIPFLWAKKLGDANKYGIPRINVDVLHKGQGVKGRLLVRKSILPFFREKAVVSATREKQVDATVCRIILQAYQILNKKFSKLPQSRFSENALKALESFESAQIPDKKVTQAEYNNIQYKAIYQSWKDVVDLSWEIIQGLAYGQKESDAKQGFSLFVDMAEIWEMYLRSLLKRKFPNWHVRSVDESQIPTYDNLFYKRKIIPDIIMERGNDVMIFDAKWKRMDCTYKEKSDVDRGDFFQIHTYIQYFKAREKNVKVGGLLYPISKDEFDANQCHAEHCLGDKNTKFIVDGICFLGKEQSGEANMKEYRVFFNEQVEAFIERIRELAK